MRRTINNLLSAREQRILQWLSEGLRDKDIGPLLGLTTRSVTRVVREICDKLDARTRTQAACLFLFELNPYPLPSAGAGLHNRFIFEGHPPNR
jgi:DNA-binding NarL/FixJ family response regulator